jgi:hypothetical protein
MNAHAHRFAGLVFFFSAAAASADPAPPPDGQREAPEESRCESDRDCGEGEFCAVAPCVPPCDVDDEACEPIECDGGGVCVPQEREPPAACTTDDDCSGGDVCITETYESCSSSDCACDGGGEGDSPGRDEGGDEPANPEGSGEDPTCDCRASREVECVTETASFCAPRWFADCTDDADCGPGFTCTQSAEETCSCSIDSAGNESCDCAEIEAPSRCELVPVACDGDDDCENGFVCTEAAGAPVCRSEDDGSTSCDAEARTERFCAPEDYLPPTPGGSEVGGGGELTNDDGLADDSDSRDGDAAGDDASEDEEEAFEDEVTLMPTFGCAESTKSSSGVMAAFALLLLRRRRR